VHGYRVTVDESIDPGRYGFRIDHDHDKTHYFSADEKVVIREWMKAIMKATIGRDYTSVLIIDRISACILTLTSRARDLIVQYSNYSSCGCSSYESSSPATISFCT